MPTLRKVKSFDKQARDEVLYVYKAKDGCSMKSSVNGAEMYCAHRLPMVQQKRKG